MATLTSNKVSAGTQPAGIRVGLVAKSAVFSMGAGTPNGITSLSSGDVIQMIKVPQNSNVVDLYVATLITGQGSYVVGDGVSTARYIAAQAVSVGATAIVRLNATSYVPYTYSTDDTIDFVYSASTNASGSGAMYMVAIISLDSAL